MSIARSETFTSALDWFGRKTDDEICSGENPPALQAAFEAMSDEDEGWLEWSNNDTLATSLPVAFIDKVRKGAHHSWTHDQRMAFIKDERELNCAQETAERAAVRFLFATLSSKVVATAPVVRTAPLSRIESLPTEVQKMILESAPDLLTVRNLVCTGHCFRDLWPVTAKNIAWNLLPKLRSFSHQGPRLEWINETMGLSDRMTRFSDLDRRDKELATLSEPARQGRRALALVVVVFDAVDVLMLGRMLIRASFDRQSSEWQFNYVVRPLQHTAQEQADEAYDACKYLREIFHAEPYVNNMKAFVSIKDDEERDARIRMAWAHVSSRASRAEDTVRGLLSQCREFHISDGSHMRPEMAALDTQLDAMKMDIFHQYLQARQVFFIWACRQNFPSIRRPGFSYGPWIVRTLEEEEFSTRNYMPQHVKWLNGQVDMHGQPTNLP